MWLSQECCTCCFSTAPLCFVLNRVCWAQFKSDLFYLLRTFLPGDEYFRKEKSELNGFCFSQKQCASKQLKVKSIFTYLNGEWTQWWCSDLRSDSDTCDQRSEMRSEVTTAALTLHSLMCVHWKLLSNTNAVMLSVIEVNLILDHVVQLVFVYLKCSLDLSDSSHSVGRGRLCWRQSSNELQHEPDIQYKMIAKTFTQMCCSLHDSLITKTATAVCCQ